MLCSDIEMHGCCSLGNWILCKYPTLHARWSILLSTSDCQRVTELIILGYSGDWSKGRRRKTENIGLAQLTRLDMEPLWWFL